MEIDFKHLMKTFVLESSWIIIVLIGVLFAYSHTTNLLAQNSSVGVIILANIANFLIAGGGALFQWNSGRQVSQKKRKQNVISAALFWSKMEITTLKAKIAFLLESGISLYLATTELNDEKTKTLDCYEIVHIFKFLCTRFERLDILRSYRICFRYADVEKMLAEKESENLTAAFEKFNAIKEKGKKDKALIFEELRCSIVKKYGVLSESGRTERITKRDIRKEYLKIGEKYGITELSEKDLMSFRETLPKECVNWGGAPTQ